MPTVATRGHSGRSSTWPNRPVRARLVSVARALAAAAAGTIRRPELRAKPRWPPSSGPRRRCRTEKPDPPVRRFAVPGPHRRRVGQAAKNCRRCASRAVLAKRAPLLRPQLRRHRAFSGRTHAVRLRKGTRSPAPAPPRGYFEEARDGTRCSRTRSANCPRNCSPSRGCWKTASTTRRRRDAATQVPVAYHRGDQPRPARAEKRRHRTFRRRPVGLSVFVRSRPCADPVEDKPAPCWLDFSAAPVPPAAGVSASTTTRGAVAGLYPFPGNVRGAQHRDPADHQVPGRRVAARELRPSSIPAQPGRRDHPGCRPHVAAHEGAFAAVRSISTPAFRRESAPTSPPR